MEFTGELVKVDIPNHFDEFGAIFDLPRIPDEDISSYKTRLQDVFVHRAGHHNLGLVYGMNRELGTRCYDAGLVIKPMRRLDGQPVAFDLTIEVKSDGIRLCTRKLEILRESHLVPTDTLIVTLNEELAAPDPYVEYLGERLGREFYRVDEEENQIIFHHDYAGVQVYVTYNYAKVIPINQTMSDVVSEINAASLPNNGSYLAVSSLAQGCLTGDTGEGLAIRPRETVVGIRRVETGEWSDAVYCPWGEVSVRALHDDAYVDTNLSQYGTYFGTILMRLVESAKNVAHVTWGQMTFGYDRFSDNMGLAEIPTLLDGRVGRWQCTNPVHTKTYRPEEAASLKMRCPRDGYPLTLVGIGPKKMQSGVGGLDDLKVLVEESEYNETETTIYDVVSIMDGTFSTPDTDAEDEMQQEGL